MEYIFRGGARLVKVRTKPLQDIEISNDTTQNQYRPVSILVGRDKAMLLKVKLQRMYDDYIKEEFKKLGYSLEVMK